FSNRFGAFAPQPGIVPTPDWSYALRQGASRSSVANDPCRRREVSTQSTASIESAAGRPFDHLATFSQESAAWRRTDDGGRKLKARSADSLSGSESLCLCHVPSYCTNCLVYEADGCGMQRWLLLET